jgi:hypothetical protein
MMPRRVARRAVSFDVVVVPTWIILFEILLRSGSFLAPTQPFSESGFTSDFGRFSLRVAEGTPRPEKFRRQDRQPCRHYRKSWPRQNDHNDANQQDGAADQSNENLFHVSFFLYRRYRDILLMKPRMESFKMPSRIRWWGGEVFVDAKTATDA